MARIITTENPSLDVRRFLKHWTDIGFVNARLREQHPGMSTDRRRTKGKQIARLVHQGLEFFESADASSTITKPLTLFYGSENLARAACICRDSELVADGLRAHGLSGERNIKRNSIKSMGCKIQSPGRDVWSHVYRALNCERYRVRIHEGGGSRIMDRQNSHAGPVMRPPAELQFGKLLRHLPEVADDVELAGWGISYMVRADSLSHQVFADERPDVINFDLRHRHRAKVKEMIDARENSSLRALTRDAEYVDVYEYCGNPPCKVPTIRADVFGDLYMDLAPDGQREMGEVPLYLGALFILSDVVRYQAENWLRLLSDHPAEEIVVDRFLDIASRKFPNLILNELNGEISEFKLAR
jgi:hypothetical protein